MKLTKNQKKAKGIYDADQEYSILDASKIVKDITFTKFDSSVDLDIRLGVDPRKADQMVRGIVALPNGTGKDQKVLVLCTPDKEEEARAAGADFATTQRRRARTYQACRARGSGPNFLRVGK